MERGDDGVIHVFEAMIVGVLILTAILFLTALSAPSQSESTGGLDLARIGADTLAILGSRDPDDPAYADRLDEIVSLALQGETDEAETFIREILPSGTRYQLRLDNGVEPMKLLPAASGATAVPRNAQAAQVYLLPNWTAHAADPGDADPADHFGRPGQALDFSSWGTLTAPDGSTTAPDGSSWLAWWVAAEPDEDRIPASTPYGLWDHDGTLLRIHGEAMTDHAVYAVQLLVWPGA